jgi:predicted MPP superfamily phosphohydrolase
MQRWLWRFLAATVGAGLAALLYALLIERTRVQLDRFTVEIAAPSLPPEGITILHLSDFHFGVGGRVQAAKIARLRRLLEGVQYDLAALTGDLIHDAAGLGAAIELVTSLRPRFGGFGCPGNHDYAEYTVWGIFGRTWQESGRGGRLHPSHLVEAVRQLGDFGRKVMCNELVRLPVAFNDMEAIHAALIRAGIEPLVNRAVCLPVGGEDLWIAGVDDLTEGRPDLPAALADVPPDAALVLLAHNPDIWLEPGVERADLILSGHTHGGQIRLPLLGAIHTQGTHLTRRQAAGWFVRGWSRMFVSRGLGESIPLRFRVRPQVALIRLVSRR